jgi:hypothetical protein
MIRPAGACRICGCEMYEFGFESGGWNHCMCKHSEESHIVPSDQVEAKPKRKGRS